MLGFKRTNLLNNSVTEGTFNPSHHYCFAEDYYSKKTQLYHACKLIEKWNRQQPLNWYYELIPEVNQQVLNQHSIK